MADDMLMMPIRVLSPEYGNEVVATENGLDEVYHTRLVIIDDISRLWLLKLQRQYQVQNEFPKYHQVVRRLGSILEKILRLIPSISLATYGTLLSIGRLCQKCI